MKKRACIALCCIKALKFINLSVLTPTRSPQPGFLRPGLGLGSREGLRWRHSAICRKRGLPSWGSPLGEAGKKALCPQFDWRLKLEFHGAMGTSDAGLLAGE